VEAVDPSLQRSQPAEIDWELGELADRWYGSVRDTGMVQPELVTELNAAHQELEERITRAATSSLDSSR
jgi:hypothetical protein